MTEGDADDKEFEKRFRIAELLLKEKSLTNKDNANANAQTGSRNLGQPQQANQQPQNPMQ